MLKVLFMGRKRVSASCLAALLESKKVTVSAVLTDSHLAVSPTADIARANRIPLYTHETAMEALRSGKLTFDLGVSMLYWRKLNGAFLQVPKYGVINFHPAPLPEYKGVGGYNLAILNGHDSWAVSAHYVDENIDTGPIIKRVEFPINSETETALSLERKSMVKLEVLFNQVMERILAKPGQLETVPNGAGKHLSRVQLEAMKRIDMSRDDVERKTRAFWFPPYDGAYVEIDGQKYTLVSRSILEDLADPNASSLFSPTGSSQGKAKTTGTPE